MVVALPPAPVWPNQDAYEIAFGNTWRIALASMFAYFCGEFVNSFVLAKMKVADRGPVAVDALRRLDDRRRGGGLGALLSAGVLRLGASCPTTSCCRWPTAQFVTKTLVEVVFPPVTYRVVAFLKRAENEDYYDRDTDFNPFKLEM